MIQTIWHSFSNVLSRNRIAFTVLFKTDYSTAGPPSTSHKGQQRLTHPSTPLGYGILGVRPLASVWTFGDHPGSHTEVRIKQDFTSVPESSWLWRKLHQKVQLFQCEGGGMLYWPACWVAYNRKSWRAWFSVSSQWWTPPLPSWTQPELHHLDTVCWISKFPTMPLSFRARPFQSVRQTWARPPHRGAPFPTYQATLGTPWSTGARQNQLARQLWARPDQEGSHSSILLGKLKHTLSHLWKKTRGAHFPAILP